MKITQPRTEQNFRQLVSNTSASGTTTNPATTGIPTSPTNVEAALTELQAEIAAIVSPTGFLTDTYGEAGAGVANLVVVAASGASYTIDCSLGNTFDITLTANCTFSIINPATTGVDSHIVVVLRQGGTGSYTVTWPASVVWQDPADGTTGGSAPTLWTAVGAQNTIELSTEDGGITWGGDPGRLPTSFGIPAIVLGTAAAAGAATTAVRTDATIVAFDATAPASVGTTNATGSAAVSARRDHVHDGSSVVGPTDHAHVASEAHLSDGSTGTYTLDEAFLSGSVIAWNVTSLARLTVTEGAPDQATVSPVGSAGDSILFDYAAVAL